MITITLFKLKRGEWDYNISSSEIAKYFKHNHAVERYYQSPVRDVNLLVRQEGRIRLLIDKLNKTGANQLEENLIDLLNN